MRGSFRPAILVTALTATMLAASAATASAAETVHLFLFQAQNGPIRVLGSGDPIPTESISFNFAAAGLTPGSRYRAIGSTRPCGKAHTGSDRVFVAKLGTTAANGTTVRLMMGPPKIGEATALRSVRLFTKHSGGVQKACGRAIPVGEGVEAAGRISFNFDRVVVAVHDGALKGLTILKLGEAGARISAILMGLPPGSTSRLLAVDQACETAVSSDSVVTRERAVASDQGVIAFLDRIPDQHSLGRENSIECLSVMKGTSGFTPRASAPAFVYHTITWD
jgi:hypothetical protein